MLLRLAVLLPLLIAVACSSPDAEEPAVGSHQMEMLVKTYPSFFIRKREEQKAFIQRMLNDADYQKRYKMFTMAFTNIFKMLEVEGKNLANLEPPGPEGNLPAKPAEFKSIVTVLENYPLVAEIVLHFPEMAYKILEEFPRWRWLIQFAEELSSKYSVYDDTTKELLSLFNQEINPDQRSEDFVNPYAETEKADAAPKKSKKQKEKPKRGPKLQEL